MPCVSIQVVALIACLLAVVPTSLLGADFTPPTAFLNQHCVDCHSGADAENGFDIDELGRDLQRPDAKRGRSILDTVGGMAKRFHQTLGPRDQQKLDQYFNSVRELDAGIQQREGWANRAKPQVDMTPPRDVADRFDIIAQTRLMHDLITLALQTDSTRFITYAAGGFNPDATSVKGLEFGEDIEMAGTTTAE